MLIHGSPTFYIISSFLILFLISFIFNKIEKFNNKIDIIIEKLFSIIIVISVISIILIILLSNKVYIIKTTDNKPITYTYTAFFSPKYKLKTNILVDIKFGFTKRYILNDTEYPFELTPIYYGTCNNNYNSFSFEPFMLTNIGQNIDINCFKNESLSKQVHVSREKKCEILYKLNCDKSEFW